MCRALDVIGNDSDNIKNLRRQRRGGQSNRFRAQGNKVMIPIYKRHHYDKKGECTRCGQKRIEKVRRGAAKKLLIQTEELRT